MLGERFDYEDELARHERFFGRAALLARLDKLVLADGAARWVVVTGGPGMGKSALLAEWLRRRERTGARIPHHFIRRGQYDWDDPGKLVGSLVAQIEDAFKGVREDDGDARMAPAARLRRALSRVSQRVLVAKGERLVVVIDGLDEYDPRAPSRGPDSAGGSGLAAAPPDDPLTDFLPRSLPDRVRVLCASRPRHPYLTRLAERDGALVTIDLDEPDCKTDNDATVRAYWTWAAPTLGLDDRFIDDAVARAGGNLQHAVQLHKELAVLPEEQRRVADIPSGLAALHDRAWGRMAHDAAVVNGLGILCAAREALAADEIARVAGWTEEPARRRFLAGAREWLVETRRRGGAEERSGTPSHDAADGGRRGGERDRPRGPAAAYRLHHESIRAYIAEAIGDAALRAHHAALAQRLASWPAPADATARRYALRHALVHRVEAGDGDGAWQLAADTSFLEAKVRDLGVDETEADAARLAARCHATGEGRLGQRFEDLARALARDSHWLREAPEATAALVWNRLRRSGWTAAELDAQLRIPAELTSFLRVRHATTRESPALVRDLVGHAGGVTACAVTPDGRRVVSASADRTLKVWDLETGRLLTTSKATPAR